MTLFQRWRAERQLQRKADQYASALLEEPAPEPPAHIRLTGVLDDPRSLGRYRVPVTSSGAASADERRRLQAVTNTGLTNTADESRPPLFRKAVAAWRRASAFRARSAC